MKFDITDSGIQLDAGWQKLDDYYYKGYSIGMSLEEMIRAQTFDQQKGNYCIISTKDPALYHDDLRSFPLYIDKDRCSNSEFDTAKKIHFPSTVDYNGTWNENCLGHGDLEYTGQSFSFNKIRDLICERLVSVVEHTNFKLPLFAANTFGVDSTLVRSVFDYVGKEYKLVRREKKGKENKLVRREQKGDDQDWGYRQLYLTDEPHVQITGYCGDEVVLRNPTYCQWLLKPHGVDLASEYAKVKESYMLGFFNKNYKHKLKKDSLAFKDVGTAVNHVRDWVTNDFQMWHKDHTITFTPFRDREILKTCLHADPDTIIRQCVHAELSMEIIRRLNPGNLESLSQHKNNYKP